MSKGFDVISKETYLVRASLLRFNRLCPVSAPFSFAFMIPSDCRVGKTASRSCYEASSVFRMELILFLYYSHYSAPSERG